LECCVGKGEAVDVEVGDVEADRLDRHLRIHEINRATSELITPGVVVAVLHEVG
jgi:hypothetical protein